MENHIWSKITLNSTGDCQPSFLSSLCKACVHAKSFTCVQVFVTLWTVAHQAPLSVGFSRQEYWSGFHVQGIFPTQGSNPRLLQLLQCSAGRCFTAEPPGKPHFVRTWQQNMFVCLFFLAMYRLLELLYPETGRSGIQETSNSIIWSSLLQESQVGLCGQYFP